MLLIGGAGVYHNTITYAADSTPRSTTRTFGPIFPLCLNNGESFEVIMKTEQRPLEIRRGAGLGY